MTREESTRQTKQEVTFLVEQDGEEYRASRKSDHQPDEDGRIPGAIYYGTGDTGLEAIETLVKTLQMNNIHV